MQENLDAAKQTVVEMFKLESFDSENMIGSQNQQDKSETKNIIAQCLDK